MNAEPEAFKEPQRQNESMPTSLYSFTRKQSLSNDVMGDSLKIDEKIGTSCFGSTSSGFATEVI